ncbi:hypothetical protein DXG01_008806 [Tephrocybe rancida]|nr:hypothetical protein DXG01_008806 [Tephrocybe rancida]
MRSELPAYRIPWSSFASRTDVTEIPSTGFNSLPFYIVEDIFKWTIQDVPPKLWATMGTLPVDEYYDDTHSLSPAMDPIKLSHVCGYWRFVVGHVPAVWSTIRIRSKTHPNQVPMLRLWLYRSRKNPLCISIETGSAQREWTPVQLKLLWLLTGEACRWKEFHARLSLPLPPVLLNLPVRTFKTLESAQIVRHAKSSIDPFPPYSEATSTSSTFWRAVHASPRITKVAYEAEYTELLLARRFRSMPWYYLTALRITTTTSALMHILSQARRLVELEFFEDPMPEVKIINPYAQLALAKPVLMYDWSAPSNITMPHLKTFSFYSNSRIPEQKKIFEFLTLPALKSFGLDIRLTNVFPARLHDLFHRSESHLETLKLTYTFVERLKCLYVNCRTTKGFLDFLQVKDGEELRFPMLESLTVCGGSVPQFGLTTFAYSRMWNAGNSMGCVPLKELRVLDSVRNRTQEEDDGTLRVLAARHGMDIVINAAELRDVLSWRPNLKDPGGGALLNIATQKIE